jgi:hypothetical protein
MTDAVDEYELERQKKERQKKKRQNDERAIRRFGTNYNKRLVCPSQNEYDLIIPQTDNERLVEAYERSVDNQTIAVWIYVLSFIVFIVVMLKIFTI